MKFCRECGHAVEGYGAFCRKCGAALGGSDGGSDAPVAGEVSSETAGLGVDDLEGEDAEIEDDEAADGGNARAGEASSGLGQGVTSGGQRAQMKGARSGKVRRPVSKKVKVFMSAAVGLVVCLVVGYFAGNSVYSKANAVERFEDAIHDEDTDALGRLLYSDDSNLDIDEAALESFLAYLDEYPSYRDEVMTSVREQAERDDSEFEDEVGVDDGMLALTTNGSKWLVFDDYQFAVASTYLNVVTDYEGTELYINDEKVATADADGYTKEIGPFMTGIYTAKAELSNDFGDLMNEQDIEIASHIAQQDVTGIQLDADFISADVAHGITGSWIVNGNDTGLEVAETGQIGPLSLDDDFALSIRHDFPWGEETSEAIAVDEDGYVYVDAYPVSGDVRDALMEAANQYFSDWARAFSSEDMDILSGVTDNQYALIGSDIESLQFWDDKRSIVLDKVIYDLDSFDIYVEDDTYYASANTHVFSHEDRHSNDKEPDLSDVNSYESVTLMYDEGGDNGKWLVDGMYTSYSDLSGETKEFVMDGDEEIVAASADEGDDDGSDDGDNAGNDDAGEADDDALADLMDSYETEIINAVNANDFGLVEPYLYESSELYEAQVGLVERLNDKGITEELIDYDIVEIVCDGDSCTIDVDETVAITYASGDVEEEDYTWRYTAKVDDDVYKLSGIAER